MNLLFAYVALGVALIIGDGTFDWFALALTVAAFVAVIWTVRGRAAAIGPRVWAIALVLFALLLAAWPGSREISLHWAGIPVRVALVAIAAASLACLKRSRLATPWLLAVQIGLFAIACIITIVVDANPEIDVYQIQHQAATALRAHQNPYTIDFPNAYDAEKSLRFYGHALERIPWYPYPPLPLLLTTAAQTIFGDLRYGYLVLVAATAVFLFAIARRAALPAAHAHALVALLLLHPRGVFLVERSWTEPVMCCAWCALVLVLQFDRRRFAHVAACASLFLGAKQYSILFVPLLLRKRLAGSIVAPLVVGALLAVALVLPFVVWSPSDFVEDVILFQMRTPFRMDALSLSSAVARITDWHAPGGIGLAAAAAAIAWSWRRLPPALPGLSLGSALLFFSFLIVEKQSFVNYYFFLGTLMLTGIAATGIDERPEPKLEHEQVP